MQIELIGCTSSGKSTLAEALLNHAQQHGVVLLHGDDVLLKSIKAHKIQNRKARALLVHLLAFMAAILAYPRYHHFFRFCNQVLKQTGIPFSQRMKQLRRLIKQTGRYESISRLKNENVIVLVDEGTVHIVHNIFVHEDVEPDWDHIPEFAKLVPLPEMLVSLETSREEIVERTLQRGHSRISPNNPEATVRFVDRALTTFDLLKQQPGIQNLLVQVQGQKIISHLTGTDSRIDQFLKTLEAILQKPDLEVAPSENTEEVTV